MYVLLALLSVLATDDEAAARARAQEVKVNCKIALYSVDGIQTVGTAGSGTDYTLILAVRDEAVKKAAARALGSDEKFEGLAVRWVLSPNSAPARLAAPPAWSPARIEVPVARPASSICPPNPAYAPGDSTCSPSRVSLLCPLCPPGGASCREPVANATSAASSPSSHYPRPRGIHDASCAPSRLPFVAGGRDPYARPSAPSPVNAWTQTRTGPASPPSACGPSPAAPSAYGPSPSAPSYGPKPVSTSRHGNNGVGNGYDPQPRGNPPKNDGGGTSPGNPGNRGGGNGRATASRASK